MTALAAKKVLKKSLRTLDEKKQAADYQLHSALLYLAGAIQEIEAKLDRLEAAAGTTPPAKAEADGEV